MTFQAKIIYRIWVLSSLFLCIAFSYSLAQKENKSAALIKFKNGKTVSLGEFEYVYQKNNGGDAAKSHTKDKFNEYLALYVKFKRKVMEAEAAGIDTTASFKAELGSYLKTLAQPYLIEKDALDALIREAYDNWRQAVSVSHILIQVEENAPPVDTLAAFNKISAIRDSILSGKKSFEYMAETHSTDPSAKDNKGNLSFFTAFDFVYPFEKASFTTPVGQISKPIRTKFGYHIIKVHEKISAPGVRNTYHILVRSGNNYEAKTEEDAQKRINEVYQKLKAGGNFAELAKEYSDDPKTKTKGGELGERYLPVPQMQEKKFRLKNNEYSEPFRSPYGWHIIKVTITDENKTFDDMKKIMRNRVTRDRRAQVAEEKLITNLKSQYKFEVKKANLDKFIANVKNEYLNPEFNLDKVSKAIQELVIFTFADKKFNSGDLINFNSKVRNRNMSYVTSEAQIMGDIEAFEKHELLAYEELQLEKKYPEFAHLKKEYRDGILLFTLTEKKVWRRAVEDTTGLKAFYEKHKNEYPAQERVRIKEFRSPVREMIFKLDSLMQQGIAQNVIDTLMPTEFFAVKVSKHTFNKTDTKSAKYYENKIGYRTPIEQEGDVYHFSCLEEFLPAGPKTFEEAKSELITKYQTELEKNWDTELEKKYPYKVNNKVFDKIFKSEIK